MPKYLATIEDAIDEGDYSTAEGLDLFRENFPTWCKGVRTLLRGKRSTAFINRVFGYIQFKVHDDDYDDDEQMGYGAFCRMVLDDILAGASVSAFKE